MSPIFDVRCVHRPNSIRDSFTSLMSMYTGAKTVVRTVYGNSSGFKVKIGMNQGSALSTLLVVIVMEAISREFRVDLPWELLYADDLVVIAETGGFS